MLIIPAIDMKNHQAVRLKQGRMEDATVYSDSVLAMVEKWISEGATRLHLVDLNGAFLGEPVHFDDIKKIREHFPAITIQVGGGIRTRETVEKYFQAGVDYCIVGTIAVKKPELVQEICQAYPDKIILGLDAKEGRVAVDGWEVTSQIPAETVLHRFENCKLEAIVYTDIGKDGMLNGMNLSGIKKLSQQKVPVIASGGLTSLEDIDQLKTIGNLYGVIAGKALYEGCFTLQQAIQRAK